MEVGITEAKKNLSKLINELDVQAEIVITKNGKSVAKLIAYTEARKTFGACKGMFTVPDDFDDSCPGVEEMFGV